MALLNNNFLFRLGLTCSGFGSRERSCSVLVAVSVAAIGFVKSSPIAIDISVHLGLCCAILGLCCAILSLTLGTQHCPVQPTALHLKHAELCSTEYMSSKIDDLAETVMMMTTTAVAVVVASQQLSLA